MFKNAYRASSMNDSIDLTLSSNFFDRATVRIVPQGAELISISSRYTNSLGCKSGKGNFLCYSNSFSPSLPAMIVGDKIQSISKSFEFGPMALMICC